MSKLVEKCALGLGHGAFVDLVCDLLGRGCRVRFCAKGGSMFPTFREGEAIIVAPIQPGDVRPADIVLFRTGTNVVAHRVVRVRRGGEDRVFITRGDASVTSDEPVEASAVLGRVVAVERGGRTVHLTGRQARLVGAVRSAAAHSRGGGRSSARARNVSKPALGSPMPAVVKRIHLRPEEAVLADCKVSGRAGSGESSSCTQNQPQCNLPTS